MRINVFIAQATGLSRRAADKLIEEQRISVNGRVAVIGQTIQPIDKVTLDNRPITPAVKSLTIMLNKPAGYVCSRDGQGSQTVYDLLPPEYHHLKPVGRLDKDSSGLLLFTNDGQLANELTHPRYGKSKVYEIELNKPLAPEDKIRVEQGVQLDDGLSKLQISDVKDKRFTVTMAEGRNRQIRRTFAALRYEVVRLHRTAFGSYVLSGLSEGSFRQLIA